MALRKPYFLPDIMDRYKCKEKTGRKIMREMGAMGRRLFVFEENIAAWESRNVRRVKTGVPVAASTGNLKLEQMVLQKRR